jgi:hypothetical protein
MIVMFNNIFFKEKNAFWSGLLDAKEAKGQG